MTPTVRFWHAVSSNCFESEQSGHLLRMKAPINAPARRWYGFIAAMGAVAFAAAPIAASMAFAPAIATRVATFPEYLSSTGKSAPASTGRLSR